ncbi:MAG: hypothetical protein ACRELB_02785 [Polyangiaceae bacterium]
MSTDRIRGKTIRFIFEDGPMAKKAFDHIFAPDGAVSFGMVDATRRPRGGTEESPGHTSVTPKTRYESVTLRDDLAAVSYLSAAGYTLTTVLDFKTHELVAFSSNEKSLGVQHGKFEVITSSAQSSAPRPGGGGHADVHR